MEQPICRHPLRGGSVCTRDPGHRGRHTSVTFYCEGCGRATPGQPHRRQYVMLGDGTVDDHFDFCFLCVKEAERDNVRIMRDAIGGW